MRGPLGWILGIVGGIVVVLIVTAAIGNRDKSGDTVPAASYAQNVCSVVGTWRGEMEAIIDEIRQAPSRGSLGVEEPQSQTPQGRRELVRTGLETSIRATKNLVEGIDNSGVPETAGGRECREERVRLGGLRRRRARKGGGRAPRGGRHPRGGGESVHAGDDGNRVGARRVA